jgi:hypothetical protein
VVLLALGPSLSYLKSRARVLLRCAILDYFPPFNIDQKEKRDSPTVIKPAYLTGPLRQPLSKGLVIQIDINPADV